VRLHFFGGKKKTIRLDGHKFDSAGEVYRYERLKEFQSKGEISGLVVHPVFVVLPPFADYRALTFTPEFQYLDNKDGKIIIEDVKPVMSYRTKKNRIRKFKFLVNDAYPLRARLFIQFCLKPGMVFVTVDKDGRTEEMLNAEVR